MLIKLKDDNIINIIDDLVEISSFGGTFGPDSVEQFIEATFETENGHTVSLETRRGGMCDSPHGMDQEENNLMFGLLELVSHRGNEDMTFSDFIHYILYDMMMVSLINITVNEKRGVYIGRTINKICLFSDYPILEDVEKSISYWNIEDFTNKYPKQYTISELL